MKKFSLFILLFFILINNGFSASTYIPPAASSVTNIGFGLVGDGQSTPLTVDTNSVASIEKMTNYISNLTTEDLPNINFAPSITNIGFGLLGDGSSNALAVNPNIVVTNGSSPNLKIVNANKLNIADSLTIENDVLIKGNLAVIGFSSNITWTYVDYRTNVMGGVTTTYVDKVVYSTQYVAMVTNIYTNMYITSYTTQFIDHVAVIGADIDYSSAGRILMPFGNWTGDIFNVSNSWDFSNASVTGLPKGTIIGATIQEGESLGVVTNDGILEFSIKAAGTTNILDMWADETNIVKVLAPNGSNGLQWILIDDIAVTGLPSNVSYVDASNTWTKAQTFPSGTVIPGYLMATSALTKTGFTLKTDSFTSWESSNQTLTIKSDWLAAKDSHFDGGMLVWNDATNGYIHVQHPGDIFNEDTFELTQTNQADIYPGKLLVWSNGSVYYCLKPIRYSEVGAVYPTPTDTNYWGLFSKAGKDGENGAQGADGMGNVHYSLWNPLAEYEFSETNPVVVSYGGFWWDCIESSTNKNPFDEPDYWKLSVGQTNPYSFWMKDGGTNVLVMTDGHVAMRTYFSTNPLPESGIPTWNLENLQLNPKTIITVLPDDGYTNKISYGNGRHFFIKTTNEVGSFVTLDASFDENVSESIILEIRGTNLTLAAINGEITGWATNDIPFADNKTISIRLNKPYMETNWTWSIFE